MTSTNRITSKGISPDLHDVRTEVVDSAWTRLKGLLGRPRLEPREGLLLRPARSIHTAFMRFPIDVVFLDRDLTVIDVVEAVRPWRVKARIRAHAVLELAAGEAAKHGIRAGTTLRTAGAAPSGAKSYGCCRRS